MSIYDPKEKKAKKNRNILKCFVKGPDHRYENCLCQYY